MQFINNRARRLAEARVLGAALAIAEHAGWAIDRHAPAILAAKFKEFLYVPQAQLLLVPAIGHPPRKSIEELVREARSDALSISVGVAGDGAIRVYGFICQWSRQEPQWWGPHIAWAAENGNLWWVPDPVDCNSASPSFMIGAGPMSDVAGLPSGDLEAGFARASAIFAHLEVR